MGKTLAAEPAGWMGTAARAPAMRGRGLLGLVLWAAWWVLADPPLIPVLLLFGPLVAVPWGLSAEGGVDSWARRLVERLQLPAALLLLLAQHQEPGLLAGLLALPWLGVTLLLATHGLSRLLLRATHPGAELAVDGAYVFILVGGGWALLDRLGARPLDYSALLVQLTAVHFHFAGFALPLLAGLVGRARPAGTPVWLALAVLGGLPLVALGLVVSQVTGWTGAELVPAWEMAGAAALVALFQLQEALKPQAARWERRLLLALSSLALLVGMFMAGAYGLSRALPTGWPPMATMFLWHGALNALGFAGLGLLARALQPPPAPAWTPSLTASAVRGRGRIGTGWFLRQGLADPERPSPPGQLRALEDVAWTGFDAAAVHPEVRAFYEQTSAFELWVRPRWAPGFGALGRLAAAVGRAMGQLVLPVDRGGAWQRVRVSVYAPRAGAAYPEDTVLYERSYADGRPMFICAYACARVGDAPYLRVSLPLPGCAMVSVMRFEGLDGGGLRLRSRPAEEGAPEEGIFLDTPLFSVRLPLHEDLRLGPLEAGFAPGPDPRLPAATVAAVHAFTLLGRPCLELDYLLQRTSDPAEG